jgi:hypothetical protein
MANPYPAGSGHLWGGLGGGVKCTSPMMWARETYTVGPLTKDEAEQYILGITTGAGLVSAACNYKYPTASIVATVVGTAAGLGGYFWVKAGTGQVLLLAFSLSRWTILLTVE